MTKRALELLAPAKDLKGAIAAIDHGADALYIGGEGFGARRAANNTADDIARVVEDAHPYGVKVYATFNTLIFEEELQRAQDAAMKLIEAGVDALIIQDMATIEMGLPVELHASTQMCNMTSDEIHFLQECGFKRVVLERGLSLEQIRAIGKSCDLELEAFIHGAICVSHSGRCLFSRALSHRSGNRGECSQPCRLSYDLITDSGTTILKNKHLLSVKDLNLSQRLGELIDAGVSSFKIEGRLKDISYTKNIVAHYRTLLDNYIESHKGYSRSSLGESRIDFTPNPSKSFTRGESEYLFDGQRRGVASFESPKSMGEAVAKVVSLRGKEIKIELLDPSTKLIAGDGVCYLSGEGLKGTNINTVIGSSITTSSMQGITPGVTLSRNFDKAFNDALESSRTKRTIATTAQYQASEYGMQITYTDCEGLTACATLETTLEIAKNPSKMRSTIEQQISKSGDTIFRVEHAEIYGEEWFVAASQLTALRREALTKLHRIRSQRLKSGGEHFSHNHSARYPAEQITAEQGVTNHLARAFYTSHGVEGIDDSWELQDSLQGARLMQSSYCIRHEIGECLKRGSKLCGDLFLVRAKERYRLEFDCAKCQMNIYKGEF